MSHWLRVLTAAFIVAVLAHAADARAQTTFFGLTFPERIGGAVLADTEDFEKSHPGYGYAVGYSRQDWKIDVFIYDMRLSAIPDDVQSPLVRGQIDQATREIMNLQQSGAYANVKVQDDYSIRDAAGRVRFGCRSFVFVHHQRGEVDSFLCLTAWKNKFVKFRLTTPRRAGSDADAREFVGAWTRVLWP